MKPFKSLYDKFVDYHVREQILVIPTAVIVLVITSCLSNEQENPATITQPISRVETLSKTVNASIIITDQVAETAPRIVSLRTYPEPIVMERGETLKLRADAFDLDRKLVRDVDFVWAVTDPRVGVIRGKSFRAGSIPGVFNRGITVTGIQNTPTGVKSFTETVKVVVLGQPVVAKLGSVVIMPSEPSGVRGQIFRMRALGFDENGKLIPGVSMVWQINDATLGRVNDLGYLTISGEPGRYPEGLTVTGIWDGVTVMTVTDVVVLEERESDEFLMVQILPQRFFLYPSSLLHLRAVALNGLGEVVRGTQIRWGIAEDAAGIIDANGVFVASDSPGVFTEAVQVEAIMKGESGFIKAVDFASVVIRERPAPRILDKVRVAPESVVAIPGARMVLLAKPLDDEGNLIEDTEINWEVVNPAAGRIDSAGSFEATFTPGKYSEALRVNVTQRLDDEVIVKTGLVDVTVTGRIAYVEIKPSLATIVPGSTVHFTVTAWDENDVELEGLIVLWEVGDPEVGTIDIFGNFRAGLVPGLHQDAIQAEIKQTFPVSQHE